MYFSNINFSLCNKNNTATDWQAVQVFGVFAHRDPRQA